MTMTITTITITMTIKKEDRVKQNIFSKYSFEDVVNVVLVNSHHIVKDAGGVVVPVLGDNIGIVESIHLSVFRIAKGVPPEASQREKECQIKISSSHHRFNIGGFKGGS